METFPEIITPNAEDSLIADCWNQIGVMGDRTCPELKTVIHCYECPVYDAVGDSLLEREPPSHYLEEWINILKETPTVEEMSEGDEAVVRTSDAISMIIFRLGNERLGLPVGLLQEVTHLSTIQPLPHRSNELFLGLVNIRGETLLCVSLSHLLQISPTEPEYTGQEILSLERMIVAGEEDNKWVFVVDEVHGIFRFHLKEIQDVPVVISKAEEGYTKGIVYWQGEKVNYLDAELLFYTLKQKAF
jgi:chemotaxis-related protein WspD